MKFVRYIIAVLVIFPFLDLAYGDEVRASSGSINTSVSATDQESFICASGSARHYFLSAMPQLFASKLAELGLLRSENSGVYRIALVIDENSQLIGYDVGDNTNENSRVVQEIISIDQFPKLDDSAKCVVGKVFLYEITLD
ncbi:hypothetical protein J7J47_02490 [Halomonas sp. ISL-60]|uniref:hypothetical protein n=1 Tax=Halomonas sp. ISL-56 TaxID=2819149 RepID=UPI001BEB8515|nr:hypothetical protein [Halomonas sp. ISL-56]MBT2771099.1 hypothetical protein [Halomonas sp. ISL-60]MBT2799825.1 hypothetical protein [Halomonas sp. ISL-56]